jgi:exodeoxyribonuclease VII small subunit
MAEKKKKEDIKFEDAISKLEEIVKKLEGGELSLEESLKAFEEGIKLSRICSKQLDSAERRIEVLVKGDEGQMKTEEFDVETPEDEDEDTLF